MAEKILKSIKFPGLEDTYKIPVSSVNGQTGDIENVLQFNEQNLNDEQKAQARANIGAAAVGEGGASGVYVLSDGESLDNVPESAVLVVDPGATLLDAEGVGF